MFSVALRGLIPYPSDAVVNYYEHSKRRSIV